MKPNRTIRVIKSTERDLQSDSKRCAATDTESLKTPAVSVTSQVTSWVKEFQQRRHPDPRRTFASLFADSRVAT